MPVDPHQLPRPETSLAHICLACWVKGNPARPGTPDPRPAVHLPRRMHCYLCGELRHCLLVQINAR